ncbi:hypothetical protein BIY37_04525 [Candidatus Brocadia sapporoensis]|uniref:Uncharacterized protein n=1 Tax=Candidatus Brocadia sapporoensis TaxID=392547 RepID=A0A1V6M1B3_9BACT|nr:hypothetical protein [Planctomycetia bacterium]OQD46192.1 hypothetical protein BIY37_04525 [Candidatus Brocadia sapporoensis]
MVYKTQIKGKLFHSPEKGVREKRARILLSIISNRGRQKISLLKKREKSHSWVIQHPKNDMFKEEVV